MSEEQKISGEVVISGTGDYDGTYEVKPTPGIEAAMRKGLGAIKERSFLGRNPQLGKMINCKVCTRRHHNSQVCVQKFVYLHTEEEVETGIKEDIYATVPRAARHGRKTHRPNANELQIIERVKDLYGRDEDYDQRNPEHLKKLVKLRIQAVRELKRSRRRAAKLKRKQQDVSRRINRGLLQGGFRP